MVAHTVVATNVVGQEKHQITVVQHRVVGMVDIVQVIVVVIVLSVLGMQQILLAKIGHQQEITPVVGDYQL